MYFREIKVRYDREKPCQKTLDSTFCSSNRSTVDLALFYWLTWILSEFIWVSFRMYFGIYVNIYIYTYIYICRLFYLPCFRVYHLAFFKGVIRLGLGFRVYSWFAAWRNSCCLFSTPGVQITAIEVGQEDLKFVMLRL